MRNTWEIHVFIKYMGNTWGIHEQKQENTWGIHGKYMAILLVPSSTEIGRRRLSTELDRNKYIVVEIFIYLFVIYRIVT